MRGKLGLLAICAAGALVAGTARGGDVALVGDFDPTVLTNPGFPGWFTPAGTSVIFGIPTDQRSRELWASNGTVGGTAAVADLAVTPVVGDSLPLGSIGSRALVIARNGHEYSSLWSVTASPGDAIELLARVRVVSTLLGPAYMPGFVLVASLDEPQIGRLVRTDGTQAGTATIATFAMADYDRSWAMTKVGTHIFLQSLVRGEVWASDGTAAGTLRLAYSSSVTVGMVPFKTGIAFFGAKTYGDAPAVWWSDGTSTNTISPAAANDSVLDLAQLGGRLYWVQSDVTNGQELWEFNGKSGATRRLSSFAYDKAFFDPGLGPIYTHHRLLLQAGAVWMLDIDDGLGGHAWWTLKPGQKSPRRLQKCPGGCPSRIAPDRAVSLGTRVVYVGGAVGAASATYASDGTPSGTLPLPVTGLDTQAALWTVVENKLFFNSTAGLWVTDGTAGATALLIPQSPRLFSVYRVGSGWWISFQSEIWTTNGTTAGTTRLQVPVLVQNKSSTLQVIAAVGPRTILCNYVDGLFTYTPGAPPERFPITSPDCRNAIRTPALGGVVIPTYGAGEREYWYSDGTFAGTHSLPLPPMPPGAKIQSLIYWNNSLVATVGPLISQLEPTGVYRLGSHGWSPWLATGNHSLEPVPVEASAPDLLFCTSEGLWRVQPGQYGAERVAPVSGCGYWAAQLGSSTVAFSSSTYQMVRCSSTACSPLPLLAPGSPFAWLKSGERVFVVTTGIHDSLRSLWRIDADGTVVNLGPTCGTSLGPPYLDEVQLLETRGRIVVGCGRLGEIWASDGTAAGTVRLMAAAPGTGDDIPAPFLAKLGDLVLMRGYDLAHGAEPWLTDGTVAGTRLLFDLNPGPRSSDPRWPVTTAVGTYFRAWDGTHGEEPWVAIP